MNFKSLYTILILLNVTQDGMDFVNHEAMVYNYDFNKIDLLRSSLLTKF